MSDTIKNVRLKDRTGNILHPEITVDAELNSTSENPIQNKVVKEAIDKNGYIIFDSQEEMNIFLDSPTAKPSIFGNLNGGLKKIYSGHMDEETKNVDIINEKPTVTGLEGSEQAASWYIIIPRHTSSMKLSVKTSGYNSAVGSTICIAKKEKNSYTLLKKINGDLIYSNNWTDLTVSIDSQYTKGDCIVTSVSNNCTYVNAENCTVTTEAYDGLVWVDNIITVDAELNSTSENPVQNKVINAKLDEVFQSVSNGKSLLETAITDKGSSVSKAGNVATFEELKTGIAGISTGTGLNIFAQTEEPTTKTGLWLKTSNTYDDVLNISDTEYSDTPDTYTKMTDIPYDFSDGSAVAIGNNIYLLGGLSSEKYNYKYDITTNTYTKMTDIPYKFYWSPAAAIGNDIYLLGTHNSSNERSKYNYKYDTLSDTYTKMADIPYEFGSNSAAAIGNDIYILGCGIESTYNYKYDTTTDTYTKMADIPYEFSNGSAVAIGNNIYLLGKSTYNYKYDTTTNTYTEMTDIPYEFSKASAVAIGNNIYLLGTNSSSTYSKNNYKYDTLSDTYTKMTDIPYEFSNGSTGSAVAIGNNIYLLGRTTYNYKYDATVSYKNSILFLYDNIPFKYKTKIFNTTYGGLNYINFDSAIMTDENGKNANVEVYIGNGTEWTKISA